MVEHNKFYQENNITILMENNGGGGSEILRIYKGKVLIHKVPDQPSGRKG